MGKQQKQLDFIFLGSKITADGDCSHEIKRCLLLGRKAMTNRESIIKQRHCFADKGPYSENYGFSSSHVWMWELDHKEGWNWKLLSHVWLCETLCIVHGILQARILEWVDVSFSRGSSQPRDWAQVSHIAGRFFTSWVIREAQRKKAGWQRIDAFKLWC